METKLKEKTKFVLVAVKVYSWLTMVTELLVVNANQICPRCGEGVFMADHGDRVACGKCGYTEMKK